MKLTNAEPLFQVDHMIHIVSVSKIAQQSLASAHHNEQAAPGVVIFLVLDEVSFQMFDAATKHRHLNVRRAGVRLVNAKFLNCLLFDFRVHLFNMRRGK